MKISVPSALRQMFLYGLGLIMMKGISLIMLPVFTRYLSPAEYGQLEILLALVNIGTLMVGLGLVDALYRFAGLADGDDQRRQVASVIFGQSLLIALIGIMLLPFAGQLDHLLPGDLTPTLLYWTLLSVIFEGVIGVPLAWLRMQSMAWFFFLCTAGRVVVQAFFIWLCLRRGMGVEGVVLVGGLTTVGQAMLMGVWQWHKTGIAWRFRGGGQYLRYGLPILISGLAGFAVAGLDRWWLAGSAGEAELAYYAVAGKFALAAGLVLQPFALWWYPKRLQLLGEIGGVQKNADFAELGAALGYLLAGGAGFIAPYFILQLTPESYHPATRLVPWLVAAMALKTQSELMNVGCYCQRDSRVQMNIHLLCSSVALFGYSLLIPSFSVVGIIATQFAVNGLRAGLFLYFSQRLLHVPYRWYGVLSAAVLMVIVLWLGQNMQLYR